MFSASLDTNQ